LKDARKPIRSLNKEDLDELLSEVVEASGSQSCMIAELQKEYLTDLDRWCKRNESSLPPMARKGGIREPWVEGWVDSIKSIVKVW